LRKFLFFFLIFSVTITALLAASDPAVRKYGDAFLEIGVGARPLGLGGAFVAEASDVTAVFWNPSGLTNMNRMQFHGMHAERFGGVVNWDFGGIGIPLTEKYALGFGFFRLGVDGIPITVLRDPNRTPFITFIDENGKRVVNDVMISKEIDDTESAFFMSFSKQHDADFSWGGSIKLIRKSAGDYSAWGIGFDFGVLYRPIQNLNLGAVLVDGTSTMIAWNNGTKELVRPHLRLGSSYRHTFSQFQFMPIMDMDLRFENLGGSQYQIGKMDLDLHGGLEVNFRNLAALRIGLDRGNMTVGAGLRVSLVHVDYAFASHSDLGNTHRISLTVFKRENPENQ